MIFLLKSTKYLNRTIFQSHKAANKLAEERIEVIGEIQKTYIPDRGRITVG